MVYFLTLEEGGKFIKIIDKSRKPESVVRFLKKRFPRFVAIFKCGMVYDNIGKSRKTNWRHVLLTNKKYRHFLIGGRKFWKKQYQELLRADDIDTRSLSSLIPSLGVIESIN